MTAAGWLREKTEAAVAGGGRMVVVMMARRARRTGRLRKRGNGADVANGGAIL